ncbi:Vacuolar protein sorting-associated protein ist1 [Boothiomyces sp. JEL0866]|nr:Vacuolar protein sorting-associated protein ist1 [Boothiomyces sp. JEL0866]KAJ3325214.1 Vacuolar protein sorting-associated protein ist1 [Boothiomyces sp. JEL0866]
MGFNPTKTKVQLKLALNRLQLVQQKKTALNQNARKEIATLIQSEKLESARVRVEHIIREDFLIEALELLALYVDTLLARFGLVETQKEMDQGVSESIYAIVYAAPRVNIQEITIIREQLLLKYGKILHENIINHPQNFVNPRIIHKLSINTPDVKLVNQYLKTIAQAFDVKFDETLSDPVIAEPIVREAPSMPAQNTFVRPQESTISRYSFTPSAPLPQETPKSVEPQDAEPDFDHLSKRFEALKKK